MNRNRFNALRRLPEGVVYRVERKGKVDFLAKWVRPDKDDGKYLENISGREPVFNSFRRWGLNPHMDLNELQHEAHRIALEKGWYAKGDRNVMELLMLIVTEIAEAAESYRNDEPEFHFVDGKPEGLGVELADTIIRICDMAEYMGIDLADVINAKMAYNKTRPYRHGNKIA